MNKPTRIHRSRKKGARQPLDELGRKPVYVGRGRKSNPSKWGNPFKYVEGTKPKDKPAERERVVSLYEDWLRETPAGRAVAAGGDSLAHRKSWHDERARVCDGAFGPRHRSK